MNATRRRFIATSAAGLAAVSLVASATPSAAQNSVDVAELMKPGPLGEKSIGNADAPITIVEYASMTCPHCANWHKNIYPYIKEKYVDTGKARLILREFPLDPLAAAVFMLARCSPEDKYFDMVGLFFDQQASWIRSNQPVDALFAIARQVGFTQDSFKTCLTNQSLLDGVNAVRERGETQFQVKATPTFFVNGQRIRDFHSTDSVEKALAPFVKS